MTKEQCRSKNALHNRQALYKGKEYQIFGVNTRDCLIDLRRGKLILNEVPCESIKLVEDKGVKDEYTNSQ